MIAIGSNRHLCTIMNDVNCEDDLSGELLWSLLNVIRPN
jgi:hypothetical protein